MQSENPPFGFLAPIQPLASNDVMPLSASSRLARVMALGPSVSTMSLTASWNSTAAIQAWAPKESGVVTEAR